MFTERLPHNFINKVNQILYTNAQKMCKKDLFMVIKSLSQLIKGTHSCRSIFHIEACLFMKLNQINCIIFF